MFKILGAKNRRKNLHKHPGPPFQIREGPGSFSNANCVFWLYENKVHTSADVTRAGKKYLAFIK